MTLSHAFYEEFLPICLVNLFVPQLFLAFFCNTRIIYVFTQFIWRLRTFPFQVHQHFFPFLDQTLDNHLFFLFYLQIFLHFVPSEHVHVLSPFLFLLKQFLSPFSLYLQFISLTIFYNQLIFLFLPSRLLVYPLVVFLNGCSEFLYSFFVALVFFFVFQRQLFSLCWPHLKISHLRFLFLFYEFWNFHTFVSFSFIFYVLLLNTGIHCVYDFETVLGKWNPLLCLF